MSDLTMDVIDATGHTSHTWDSSNPDEVAAARALFDSLTRNNRYRAFRVGKGGRQGERMDQFDPEAEHMTLTPHVAGG